MKKKVLSIVFMLLSVCTEFTELKGESFENNLQKIDDFQFIKKRSKLDGKNTEKGFIDIPGSSYTPIGHLSYIAPFGTNEHAIPVLKLPYSNLISGMAVINLETPTYYKKGRTFSLEIQLLTENVEPSIEGRLKFKISVEVFHKDGTVDQHVQFFGGSRKDLFVRSASGSKVARYYNKSVKLNFNKFQEKDIIILKLSRLHKVPDNYPGTVSIMSTRVHWNKKFSKEAIEPDETQSCGAHTSWSSTTCGLF